ncbi:MAG: hypothetical protein Q9199_003464 [Rusavskia elegans]
MDREAIQSTEALNHYLAHQASQTPPDSHPTILPAHCGPPGHVDLEALNHTLSYTPDHFRTAFPRLPHESSALLPARRKTITDCDATIPKDRGIGNWGGLDYNLRGKRKH